MTTAVTIKMTTPHNHKDIMVDILDGMSSMSIRVRDGEETEVCIYDSRTFSVREVDKEVSEGTDNAEPAEPAVAGAGDSGDSN